MAKGTSTKAAPAKGKAAKPAKGNAAPAAAPAKLAEPHAAKPAAPVTVTLKHLAAGISEQHGLPRAQAEAVLAGVFEAVAARLKARERVRIGGFGVIEVKDRPARMGRNPATGEAIQIAASRKLAFRAAKELKAAI
jgi:DNA-binding protein HU-beta